MSPIPTQTNKDIGKKETSVRDGSTDSDSNRIVDGLVDINQATAGETQPSTSYSPLAQHPNPEQEIDDDDDDDDDEDSSDDEVEELNEDVHFEMLASSRVFASTSSSNKPQDQANKPTVYSFETDFFERKSCLESEEIVVDEAKSNQISQLMSGFKLPESSIPDWAKLVPENVWKQNLLQSIQAKKTDLFSSTNPTE